jgi:hypothetical protein
MAGLLALRLQPDPNDRPTWAVGLTYLASTLLGAGGLLSIVLGSTSASARVFGLSGGYLEIAGIVGVVDWFAILVLGIEGWWHPRTARGSGEAIIVLSVLGLITSVYGFYFVGTVIGIAAGVLTIRAKPRRETPPPDWRTDKPPPLPDWSPPK